MVELPKACTAPLSVTACGCLKGVEMEWNRCGNADKLQGNPRILPRRRFLFDSRMLQMISSCVYCHLWQFLKAGGGQAYECEGKCTSHCHTLISACQIPIQGHQVRTNGHGSSISGSLAQARGENFSRLSNVLNVRHCNRSLTSHFIILPSTSVGTSND